MKHLTEEQLSGLLDDALASRERSAAEAHLADCEACRARLAEASALEESLGRALTHDPGEAYFADFAERVSRRIAAGEASGAQAGSALEPSVWRWLVSPRGLALAGSTAALLLTAGIAWMRFHNEDGRSRLFRLSSPSPLGANLQRDRARPPAREEDRPTTPAPQDRAAEPAPPSAVLPLPPRVAAPSASMEAQPSTRGNEQGPTRRAQEVRTLPNGEQVPVRTFAAPEANAPSAGASREEQRPNERDGAASRSLAAPTSPVARIKQRALVNAKDERGEVATSATPAESKLAEQDKKQADDLIGKNEPKGVSPTLQKSDALQRASADSSSSGRLGAVSGLTGLSFDQRDARAPQPPAAASTAPAPAAGARERDQPLRGGRGAEYLYMNAGPGDTLSPCGVVRDSRGHPIAGAEVTAVRGGVRSARTGRDGRFCFESLRSGDTLTVLRVGYEPLRVVMSPATSLAFRLEPVGTLGPEAGRLVTRDQGTPSFATAPEAPGLSRAPAADVYAEQTESVRATVAAAREAFAAARKKRTADAFEDAAQRWFGVRAMVTGAAALDARFQALGSLREAFRAEPTAERAIRLRQELAAFVAESPRSLPERATAARWQSELHGDWSRIKAGYR